MLTVFYNYDLAKYGVPKRQERIREQAKFSCKCPRCLDPTDLSTFSGAVVCFKCKSAFMLPLSPLDPESDWKCNGCPYTMCQSFVSSFVEGKQEEVDMARAEAEDTGESVVDIIEDFISENSTSVLHPNHWVLTMAAQIIINHQSKRLHDLSLEELDKLIGHCEHVLKIRNATTPGISTEKGILQHHIARAKFRKLEYLVQQKLLTDPKEIEKEVKVLFEAQKTAVLFWQENPHYGTLHANYKADAETLISEKEELQTQYPFLL